MVEKRKNKDRRRFMRGLDRRAGIKAADINWFSWLLALPAAALVILLIFKAATF